MNEPSAFAQDEKRRIQQEAETVLKKSIGIQDAGGNRLHGHERTERSRDLRAEMKAAAATQPAGAPPAVPAAEKGPEPLRFAVNAPNRATVRGMQVALFIPPAAPAGANEAATPRATPWQPIPGATSNTAIVEPYATLLKTNLTLQSVVDFSDEWTLVLNDIIYLEMENDGAGELLSVTLIGGAPWVGATSPFDYPEPVETTGTGTMGDPYLVTKTRYLVAYTAASDDTGTPAGCMTLMDGADTIKVIQCVFTPLGLVLTTRDGLTFEYPAPTNRIP